MKKVLLSLGIVVSLFASDKLLPKKEVYSILKSTPIYAKIKMYLKNGQVKKIRGIKKDGFYILQLETKRGNTELYVTVDKKYTILGNVIDNKTFQAIKGNFPAEPFHGNKEIVKKGVLFSFGKGKKDLYLVTDPQCPYCRLMEKDTKDNLDKNYRVHIILYPLSFHKYAKAMSYYILAGKTDKEKVKRFKSVLAGSNEWKNFKPTNKEKIKFIKELARSKKAVDELGARGTPSLYNDKFQAENWTKFISKKTK